MGELVLDHLTVSSASHQAKMESCVWPKYERGTLHTHDRLGSCSCWKTMVTTQPTREAMFVKVGSANNICIVLASSPLTYAIPRWTSGPDDDGNEKNIYSNTCHMPSVAGPQASYLLYDIHGDRHHKSVALRTSLPYMVLLNPCWVYCSIDIVTGQYEQMRCECAVTHKFLNDR